MAEAPDIPTLYRIAEYVEDCLKSVLTAAGCAGSYTQRETEELPKARIDLQFTLGAEFPHYFKCPDGKRRNDLWRGTLRVMIVHDRSRQKRAKKTKFSDFIGTQKGLVKAALSDWVSLITAENLPYHQIRFFQEQVTTPSIAADDDVDVAVINYNLVIGIRQSAWPGSTPVADPYIDDGFGNAVQRMLFRIPGSGTLPAVSDPPDTAYILKAPSSKLFHVNLHVDGCMEVKEYDDGTNDGEWLQTDGTPRDTTFNTYAVIASNPPSTNYINRYWSGADGSRKNAISFDFSVILRGGDTLTLAARTIDNSMIGLPSNLSIAGVTDPPQPYVGQWANVDVVSIVEV